MTRSSKSTTLSATNRRNLHTCHCEHFKFWKRNPISTVCFGYPKCITSQMCRVLWESWFSTSFVWCCVCHSKCVHVILLRCGWLLKMCTRHRFTFDGYWKCVHVSYPKYVQVIHLCLPKCIDVISLCYVVNTIYICLNFQLQSEIFYNCMTL